MRIELAGQMALETRKRLQDEARAIGISEEYIFKLVTDFYVKVRAHPELGPVFDDVILDNWPDHLQQMELFWTSIALRTGSYHGQPMPVHRSLTNAHPEHFKIWLDLFEQTLRETAPNPKVVDYFMGYANLMAERLSRVMFS
ncbi:truncated hemoglobin [soil metagenome]